tara:strand:- start:230 stop:1348 length:1119 start_codon:yes stop_codon:yes gene_type:complete
MIIGGPLEFDAKSLSEEKLPSLIEELGFKEENVVWTRSGRSAISFVLEVFKHKLSEGWLLLPDYQCWSVNSAFQSVKLKNYNINSNLEIDLAALDSLLNDSNIQAILLIDFFGLSDINSQISFIKQKRPDILIFIDAAQSFFSLIINHKKYENADAIILSLRKFLPISDGGSAIFPEMPVNSLTIDDDNISKKMNHLYFSASAMRTIRRGFKFKDPLVEQFESKYLSLFQQHNELFDNQVNPISSMSKEIIERTDLKKLALDRKDNFLFMRNLLLKNDLKFLEPIFGDTLGPALVFPVRVKNSERNNLRQYLQSKGIYCPVHWPIPSDKKLLSGSGAITLSKEILGLPIDQSCNKSTMLITLEEILTFLEKF